MRSTSAGERSPIAERRRRRSSIRRTGGPGGRPATSRPPRASCKPTPMPGSTGCPASASPRSAVGRPPGASGRRAREGSARRGRTHHTKPDVAEPAVRVAPEAVGRARVVLGVVPGPAAKHTGSRSTGGPTGSKAGNTQDSARRPVRIPRPPIVGGGRSAPTGSVDGSPADPGRQAPDDRRLDRGAPDRLR